MTRLIVLIIAAVFLSGCIHAYVPTVDQGNVLTEKQLNQLHKGMTKDDVQYLLGAPVLQNSIQTDRWDYIYTQKVERKPLQEKRLTLYFRNNKLYQIDNVNYVPEKMNGKKPKS